jgi:hypothetical protein
MILHSAHLQTIFILLTAGGLKFFKEAKANVKILYKRKRRKKKKKREKRGGKKGKF